MDSKMNDESRNRRREEALARRLGEALDEQASPRGPEPCPDAELIAAYHEQELGPEEVEACDLHFATCSRCRKILAVLAASDDAPLAEKEVARLGELVAAAQVSHAPVVPSAKFIRPKRTDGRLRWLAPAIGVAAALAVWFAVRPPWRSANQGTSGSLVAQALRDEKLPPVEGPSADQLSQSAPAQPVQLNSEAASAARENQRAAEPEALKAAPEALAKKKPDQGRAAAASSPNSQSAEISNERQVGATSELNAPAPAAPPPPPNLHAPEPLQMAQAQSGGAGQAAPPAPESPRSMSQSVTVTGQAPVVASTGAAEAHSPANDKQAAEGKTRVSDLPLNGRNVLAFGALKTADQTFVQIGTPSGKILWRVGKNGHIERSINGGGAWVLQSTPSAEDWLAGAAASDTICWIVGRNGSIARTTDGQHWEKIAPPAASADATGKFPDWIGVTSSSAQTATIMASDQRRYTTHDGGKTWLAQ